MRQFARWVRQTVQTPLGQKLSLVMLLAIALSLFCMMGLVLGSALLLMQVGARGLPWVYVSLGVVSLPLYLGLAQIVDRVPRPRLLQMSLGGAIAFLGLAIAAIQFWPTQPWIYSAIDVGLYSFWILILEVLFPSFVADYFTAIDWQRCSTAIRMAIACGGLLGGGIVALCAQWWPPERLLWIWGGVAMGAMGLVYYLAHALEPIPSSETTTVPENPISQQAIADYPIIPFLAGSTFLTILLYCLGEYLYLDIYSQTFTTDGSLTQFLGMMRMVNNVIPLIVLYGVTQPLLHRFGVVLMNLAYPLTTLGAFIGLGTNPTLGIALAANLNNDGLDDSLNQPIAILNYNAVPYQWVGRVRALCHGLMYSVGLMLAGGILALLQAEFTRTQIVTVGLGASLLFVLLRYGMGQRYLRSLLQLLRNQRLDWEQVGAAVPQLPMQYSLQVDELLRSGDRTDQLLGITLATRLSQPQHCLPDLLALANIAEPDSPLWRRLGRFFREHPHLEMGQYLIRALPTLNPRQQHLSLEALIHRHEAIPVPLLTDLLRSADPTVRGLSYVTAQTLALEISDGTTLCEALPLQSRLTVLRVIRASHELTSQRVRYRRLIPLVQRLLEDQAVEVVRAGLETLAVLASPGEKAITAVAQRELSTFDPLIRAINMRLLGQLQNPQFLLDVAVGLEHRQLSVRLWAAQALAQYGNKSLRFAKLYLNAKRPEVVTAAIAALGKVGTAQAIDLLYQFLEPDYQRLKQLNLWQTLLPRKHPDEQRLHAIMLDAQERVVAKVWSVLKALEKQSSLLQEIEPFLQIRDDRLRANAIERLASGRWRRFILPLLPLLTHEPPRLPPQLPSGMELIEQLWQSDDSWLRLGALLWLANHDHPIPEPLCADPDPLVQRIANSLAAGHQEDLPENDWFLKQLFFLEQKTPLGLLSLDELAVINPLLNQRDFRQGETICTPENAQAQFYLVYQGTVQFDPLDITLTEGEVFGVLTLWETATWQQTVTAQTDCSVLTLSQLRLEELIDRCPRILWCLAQLSDRLDYYQSQSQGTGEASVLENQSIASLP